MNNKRSSGGKPTLIFRVESRHSPPLLTFVGTTVISSLIAEAVGIAADKVGTFLRGITSGEWRNAYQRDIFRPLKTAELIIGERYPDKENPYSPDDVECARKFIKPLPFSMPEVKEESSPIPLRLERNVLSFGSGISNAFSQFLMGKTDVIEEHEELKGLSKDLVPDLPYTFNFRFDPRSKDMSLDEIRRWDKVPPLNYSIESKSGGEVYIPSYDSGLKTYVKDYLMIVKCDSIHEKGRTVYGSKNLVVAGCHGIGTRAGKEVLKSEEELKKIHDEVGTGNFQAIFEVQAGEGKEVKRVKLLELEAL